MIHRMNLDSNPFEMIKNGTKTIELRLNDDKRRKIKVGDYIIFRNSSLSEIFVEVVRLHHFKTFKELYENLPLDKCGYDSTNIDTANYTDMDSYYTNLMQKKYGVLGIEVKTYNFDQKKFTFKEFVDLRGSEINLRLNELVKENLTKGYVPSYRYNIVLNDSDVVVGLIDIRIGYMTNLFYGGHIGYRIEKEYRGNKYAKKACELIFEIAKSYDLEKIYITCDPNNIASRKTCEALDLNYIGLVDLPVNNEMYLEGKREVLVFEKVLIKKD